MHGIVEPAGITEALHKDTVGVTIGVAAKLANCGEGVEREIRTAEAAGYVDEEVEAVNPEAGVVGARCEKKTEGGAEKAARKENAEKREKREWGRGTVR